MSLQSDNLNQVSNTEARGENAFSFSEENKSKALKILQKYPADKKQSALVPLLDLAQEQSGGWLPTPAIVAVADIVGMTFIKAFEVASFYSMINLKPVGKHHIQVCRTTPCWLRGSDEITAACKKYLKIDLGETTKDGLFTLTEVECIGACINAPAIQINKTFVENLTPESMVEKLNELKQESKDGGK